MVVFTSFNLGVIALFFSFSLQNLLTMASILQLAFQSIGVVYRNIGTSPLYVFAATFTYGIHHLDDILGAFPLIIYFLTLFPLIKYIFNVLWANDDPKIIDFLRLICFCILIFGYKLSVKILHFGYKLIVNIYEMKGGKFALYSLICRHAKLSVIPNQQEEHVANSSYKHAAPSRELHRYLKIK